MFRLLLAACLLCTTGLSYAGLTLGATRVIYAGDGREASISLHNSDTDRPYLVQSWIDSYPLPGAVPIKPGQNPFIITPPIFKLPASSQNIIRVVRVRDGLAQDRESLFRLNVNAIPATDSQLQNRMLIATRSELKLIYRPEGLNVQDALSAYQKLKLSPRGQGVQIDNPTPYFVNLGELNIDGENILHPGVIPPFSSRLIAVSHQGIHRVSLKAINDYGGLTARRTDQF